MNKTNLVVLRAVMLLSLCSASSAVAESWECRRTHLGSIGFSSSAVAESWFPLNEKFIIKDDSVTSDHMGSGEVLRKKNRIFLKFYDQGADRTRIITLIPSTKIYTARLDSISGYSETSGTTGKCNIKK